jgi:putative sugar O-methyltransferase
MWRIADQGQHRFGGDARYDLQSVTDGFVSRIDDLSDDTALLERICAAYTKAVKQQQFVPQTYRATEWWEQVQQRSLGPVMRALLAHDIDALRGMYRNFFRDPCSTGLIGVPYGMSKAYFAKTIKDAHRRFYLSDVLYRIDHWMERTNGHFALRDLAGPGIGNPFGVLIDGTLVEEGAEYRHYCAYKVSRLLDLESATVAEIGGGFGGMAYYLLRDRPGVTYLDFDVAESIALTSYYLMKAFPHSTFLLYGEEEPTMEAIARSDVVLLPLFELPRMPAESVAVTFSSHAMSDISTEAQIDYLDNIARVTRRFFLYMGIDRAGQSISDLIAQRYEAFKLAEMRSSGWHSHKISSAGEVERLYRISAV